MYKNVPNAKTWGQMLITEENQEMVDSYNGYDTGIKKKNH